MAVEFVELFRTGPDFFLQLLDFLLQEILFYYGREILLDVCESLPPVDHFLEVVVGLDCVED